MKLSDRKSGMRPDPDNIEFVKKGNRSLSAAPRRKKKKELSLKTGIIVICLLVVVLLVGGLILYPMSSSSKTAYGGGSPYVGVLVVDGEISGSSSPSDTYQHGWILRQIREMRKDPVNEGILLYVNSPGGSVFESDELYEELVKYQKKTRRPLYAYFHQQAASGGYYIAARADKIIANKLCTTGSIGVYAGPVIDSSGLLENLGISVNYIKSGKNKAMGNPFTPLTEEQQEIYQSHIDEYYERFADIVSKGRRMPLETVYKIGDGRSYTATQAKKNGLIDVIGNYEKAKAIMKKDCHVNNFVVVQYKPEVSVMDYFRQMNETFRQYVAEQGKSETQKTMEYLTENAGHVFYYESFD